VALELDGRAVHRTPAAFEKDRERDRMLAAENWRTVRVTWRQLTGEPAAVAADLQQVLGDPPNALYPSGRG
jgi:very-short-patch-repair endonuclease